MSDQENPTQIQVIDETIGKTLRRLEQLRSDRLELETSRKDCETILARINTQISIRESALQKLAARREELKKAEI